MKRFFLSITNSRIKSLFFVIILYAVVIFCFACIEKAELPIAWHINCSLDRYTPFSKYVSLFYCLWHVEIFVILLYLYLYKSKNEFLRSSLMIWLGFIVPILFYLICPNEIDLRPATVKGNDIFAILTRIVWFFDSSRNVFPSGHAIISYLMTKIWKRNLSEKSGHLMTLLNMMIIVSTLFLKQHSIIDVIAGLITGIVIEMMCERMPHCMGS